MKLVREKAIFMILVLIVGFISFSFSLQEVSAENRVCCEKTKEDSDYNGASCIFTTQDNCDPSGASVSSICENTLMCSPICCVKNGECEQNVLKEVCLDAGGIVKQGATCDIQQCQEGCCMLSATNAFFTTLTDCADLVEPYENLELNDVFDADVETEAECILKARGQEQGCCVVPDGKCAFTTRANCPEGDFERDTLCSYEPLGCECTEKHEAGCREGYEEVYWFDSCGNPENIYGTTYLADGKVVSKEESCNVPDSVENNNVGEDSLVCGNCNYAYSSICMEADNNFLDMVAGSDLSDYIKPRLQAFCTDLKCYNTQENSNILWMNGQTRENGESWCEYEGAVGNGLDLVGSRHILHQCINGREIVLPCQEERKEVCVQGKIPTAFPEVGGQTSALCKPNFWPTCLAQNDQDGNCNLNQTVDGSDLSLCSAECDLYLDGGTLREGMDDEWNTCCEKQLCRQEACNAYDVASGCYWNQFFGLCLPGTPIGGFDESFDLSGSSPQEVCDLGDVTCTELWEKSGYGSRWKCVENCDCHEKVYGTEANKFCRSLGDCGINYNVLGDPSSERSFRIRDNAPRTKESGFWGETETFGHNTEGFDVRPFSAFRNVEFPLNGSILLLSSVLERLAINLPPNYFNDNDLSEFTNELLKWGGGTLAVGLIVTTIFTDMTLGVALGALVDTAAFWTGSAGFSAAAAQTAYITAYTAAYDAAIAGGATVAEAGALATTEAAAAEGASLTGFGGSTVATVINVIIVLAIIVAVTALVIWIISLGYETSEIHYWMDCDPWVAPVGGENCGKCDDFTVCDEYKCKSLGLACNFTNKGFAGQEMCIWQNPQDLTPPIIKPLMIPPKVENDIIKTPAGQGHNGGYEFKETFNAYTKVGIGISTLEGNGYETEPAICKISRIPALQYNDMIYYFNDNDSAIVKTEHILTVPFLSSGMELDPDEDKIVLEAGTINDFYVKCMNTNGVANIKDYFIKIKVNNEPDGTAPVIEEYSLRNGATLPAGNNETSLTLYLNELAQGPGNLTNVGGCRWSNIPTLSYTNMVNDFVCSEDLVDREHFACSGILTGLEINSDFYFKCRDAAGNSNQKPQPLEGFHLYVSEGLEITSYSPLDGEIYANGETLELQTSGGSSGDGTSVCYYSLTKFFDVGGIRFDNTNSYVHTNEFETLSAGQHTYYAWCEDSAGNGATQEITFTLLRDEDSPELDRIYVDGTKLYIQLNEAAECEYSLDGPFSFGIEGNSQMEPSGELTHFCQLVENGVYNIVCQDSWENQVSFVVYP